MYTMITQIAHFIGLQHQNAYMVMFVNEKQCETFSNDLKVDHFLFSFMIY